MVLSHIIKMEHFTNLCNHKDDFDMDTEWNFVPMSCAMGLGEQ
jgi:hypothetical protein